LLPHRNVRQRALTTRRTSSIFSPEVVNADR